ncbi:MAG: type II secretion system F family protein [Candidatus Moranbacteria bacterium]|nr:type II secretion system F family protein [Candidatus Moranbacteria bacterium]
MPKFQYYAKNEQGEEKKDIMEAQDKKSVAEELKKDGYWLVYIEEKKKKKSGKTSSLGGFFSVPLKNKMIFCRHLAVMVSSGLSLSKALTILGNQESNKTFKKIILSLADDVKKGVSLADSMEKYPKAFSKIFVSMVRVGEKGGSLEEILKILARQLEKDHDLISKIRGALIYPAIIIVVMIIIAVLMMVFVIPKITRVFEGFDAELPIMTQIVIAISDFMSSNILLTFGIIIAIAASIFGFYKTEPGIKFFHKVFLKFPIVGTLVTKVNSARFARILSSMLKSGVSLVEALDITADTLGNRYFKRAAGNASEKVQKGVALSEVLSKYEKVFPYLVIQMVKVGEDTGQTPEILLKLAQFYEGEVDQTAKNLSSVIEPILMVIIGAAVGFFAVAIIQPIYSLMEVV